MAAGEQTWITHTGLPERDPTLIGQVLRQETLGLLVTSGTAGGDDAGRSSSGGPVLTGVDLGVFGVVANHAATEGRVSAGVSGARLNPKSQHFFLKRSGFDI